ncbi:hypothetical protein [Kushneria indalinina]|uniref:hypothetical protein n=1 Tax=Kushneria indalinina TaxID=184067 RepID=UPI003CCC7CDC
MLVGIGCHVELVGKKGEHQRIATTPHAQEGYRLNDARLDPSNRLWVGLMYEGATVGLKLSVSS